MARAYRRLIGGTALEEVMEPADSKQESFTRVAYFSYNTVNQQYEYFSIDTRAPQMMNEKGHGVGEASAQDHRTIALYRDSFVAPKWGDATNVAFRYRIAIGPVERTGRWCSST